MTVCHNVQMTELLYKKQTQLEHLAAQKAAQQLTLEREVETARQQAERMNRCSKHAHLLPCTEKRHWLSVSGVVMGNLCCGRRVRTDRAAAPCSADGDVVVPMEAMGEAYRRLANNDRVGGAVKAGALCVSVPMFISSSYCKHLLQESSSCVILFAFHWRVLSSLCRVLDATASSVVRVLKQYPLGRLGVFLYAIFIHLFIWLLINRLQHRALYSDHLGAANQTHPLSLMDQI